MFPKKHGRCISLNPYFSSEFSPQMSANLPVQQIRHSLILNVSDSQLLFLICLAFLFLSPDFLLSPTRSETSFNGLIIFIRQGDPMCLCPSSCNQSPQTALSKCLFWGCGYHTGSEHVRDEPRVSQQECWWTYHVGLAQDWVWGEKKEGKWDYLKGQQGGR